MAAQDAAVGRDWVPVLGQAGRALEEVEFTVQDGAGALEGQRKTEAEASYVAGFPGR